MNFEDFQKHLGNEHFENRLQFRIQLPRTRVSSIGAAIASDRTLWIPKGTWELVPGNHRIHPLLYMCFHLYARIQLKENMRQTPPNCAWPASWRGRRGKELQSSEVERLLQRMSSAVAVTRSETYAGQPYYIFYFWLKQVSIWGGWIDESEENAISDVTPSYEMLWILWINLRPLYLFSATKGYHRQAIPVAFCVEPGHCSFQSLLEKKWKKGLRPSTVGGPQDLLPELVVECAIIS